MDQIKIGKFIAKTRKEKDMTQKQLADALLISDKTVSKWECGKGLPEVSLMLPLCEVLDISVNDLLTGERVSDLDYKKKAEVVDKLAAVLILQGYLDYERNRSVTEEHGE